MQKKYLKKVLAGIGIAGLVAGAQAIAPKPVVAGSASGWSSKKTGAVSTEEKAASEEKAMEKKSTHDKEAVEEKASETAKPAEEKMKAGKSGWSGSK
jgi:radical SAM modification target selenobiotic family peptide